MEAREVTQTGVSQGASLPLSTVSSDLIAEVEREAHHVAGRILQGGSRLHRPVERVADRGRETGLNQNGDVLEVRNAAIRLLRVGRKTESGPHQGRSGGNGHRHIGVGLYGNLPATWRATQRLTVTGIAT